VAKRQSFSFYRNKTLYYKTEKGLLFEIPESDTGDAVFNAAEKASTLMKWIRKQLEVNEEGKKVCTRSSIG
jgi:hypothetical protein